MFGDLFKDVDAVWFYAVPFALFAPIYFSFVWHIGVKNLFRKDHEKIERQRLHAEHEERIAKRRESKAGTKARVTHRATLPSRYWAWQGAIYVLFLLAIGVFSASPTYTFLGAGQAQIKMNLTHPGQRVEPCIKRTKEELAKLAPNMRAKMKCSRERSVVKLELELDGNIIFEGESIPTGLRRDGSSNFYKKFFVAAGEHKLTVRMNDGDKTKPYTHELSRTMTMKPTQNIIVGFHEHEHRFYFK